MDGCMHACMYVCLYPHDENRGELSVCCRSDLSNFRAVSLQPLSGPGNRPAMASVKWAKGSACLDTCWESDEETLGSKSLE